MLTRFRVWLAMLLLRGSDMRIVRTVALDAAIVNTTTGREYIERSGALLSPTDARINAYFILRRIMQQIHSELTVGQIA
jgi:hypothetical protein